MYRPKKTRAILKISDLQESFVKRIERMVSVSNEGRVVFDRYLESSLKNKTRQKRSKTSVEFKIHPEIRHTMSIKDLLSSAKSKNMLVNLTQQHSHQAGRGLRQQNQISRL